MPEELHAELSRASERQGVSLNAFITGTLAAAVGRKDALPAPQAGRRSKRATAATQPSRRRILELLLVVNLVVVGAVGVLAAVLLAHALS
jgi:HicB family